MRPGWREEKRMNFKRITFLSLFGSIAVILVAFCWGCGGQAQATTKPEQKSAEAIVKAEAEAKLGHPIP